MLNASYSLHLPENRKLYISEPYLSMQLPSPHIHIAILFNQADRYTKPYT